MKYSLVLVALLSVTSLIAQTKTAPAENTTVQSVSTPATSTVNVVCPDNRCQEEKVMQNKMPAMAKEDVLKADRALLISVVGQGVAPMNTASPAQAYALAKRAAVADAYRLIAEKVKGVRVDGQDLIQNMMVKRSTVRTSVEAMVKNANIVETTFKEGLCEVEMEITLSHSQFPQ